MCGAEKKPDRGLLIVVSGPSGVGKGTVCSVLCKLHPDIRYSVSATTRAPRRGERHGVNYFFLTREDFLGRRERGDFLEWAQVYDNFYGTLRADVQRLLDDGYDVLLEIDPQGAAQIKAGGADAVFVFILPPSLEELRRRIVQRGTESPEVLQLRLSKAESEIAQATAYDYRIINRQVAEAAAELAGIVRQEKQRRSR